MDVSQFFRSPGNVHNLHGGSVARPCDRRPNHFINQDYPWSSDTPASYRKANRCSRGYDEKAHLRPCGRSRDSEHAGDPTPGSAVLSAWYAEEEAKHLVKVHSLDYFVFRVAVLKVGTQSKAHNLQFVQSEVFSGKEPLRSCTLTFMSSLCSWNCLLWI